METSLRRCGRTHCPPGAVPSACALHQTCLNAVPATLLIPLVARAWGRRVFPWLACHDQDAAHLLGCLQVDPTPFLSDRALLLNVLWRTRLLRQWGTAFFARYPQASGVNLGSGLSNHFQWLDNGHNRWLDADLPEVQQLRLELLPPQGPRRALAAFDLSRSGWWDALDLDALARQQPLWLLCEGVLMYLKPARVHAIVAEFAQRAPAGSVLVLDAIAHLGVGQARHCASVAASGAEFRWGLCSTDELAQLHPRLRQGPLRSVAECYGPWGAWCEALSQPWCGGVPLYSMQALGVAGAPPAPARARRPARRQAVAQPLLVPEPRP